MIHSCAKFLPHWFSGGAPKKTKNILNFYKILGHKRLSLVYYFHNFYVIFRDHGELHEGSRYKIWGDSFKAFHSYSRGF